MTGTSLRYESAMFGADLALFADRYNLPPSLFADLDHVAFEASNIKEFGRVVRGQLAPLSWEMLCAEKQGRFIAEARLKDALPLYHVAFTQWVSIEEGRKEVAEGLALDYVAFYHDSLEMVRSVLGNRGIKTRLMPEEVGGSVRAKIGPTSPDLRFVNTSLISIARSQLESGEAIEVDLSASRQTVEFVDGPAE